MKNFITTLVQSKLKVFLTLLILGFACYFSVIKGPFFFDDEQFIVKNEYVLNLDVKKIYSTSVTEGAKTSSNFYRPNQQLAFALLYKAFGLNPIPFHITSILFHVLNSLLLFLMLCVLLNNKTLSYVGAILFLIHPIQTEAVAYISGFADVLATFFMLGGLLALIKYWNPNDKKLLILSFLSFVLALFTKESVVIIAPISVLIAFYVSHPQKTIISKKQYISLGLTCGLCLIYLGLKFTIFNFSAATVGLTTQENLYTDNLHVRIYTFISIIQDYFKMYLFPIELYYGKPYVAYPDLISFRAVIGLIAIGLTIFSLYTFNKNKKIALGFGWFFAALIPFTGIIPLNSMFLEHWMYVPIIGLILSTLFLVEYLQKFKLHFFINTIAVFVFLAFTYKTYARSSDWANIEKFYLTEIKYNKNVSNFTNLGMYYADKKNDQKAIYYYKQSIAIYDAFPQPHYNLANIYINQQKYEEAGNELYLALKIDPNFIYALNKLQQLYTSFNQQQKANAIAQLTGRINKGETLQIQEVEAIINAK